ncbi:hypothetical protein PSTT_03841 [Puccinia striiformis]|uniref:HTH CENPB-type domain-containing protein n=1 Tax=Puccinia striiformis TaxID=27350 RepID=A0A2S4VV70_9BASI|nr:hypothetical protein PSTT_03841 [Puccinia striiformis]
MTNPLRNRPKKSQKDINKQNEPSKAMKAVSSSSNLAPSTSIKPASAPANNSSQPKKMTNHPPAIQQLYRMLQKSKRITNQLNKQQLKFGINQTSLSSWLKEKSTIQKRVTYNGGTVKCQRTAAYPRLEQALYNWFLEAQSHQMPTNDEILRTKAHKFANLLNIDLKLSNGWLYKFKNRFHIQMPPNKSLATETCSGLKGSKIRLTYHLCCNADGSDKLEPLVIGNAKKPRCFGKKLASYWGYDYHHNKTAWMTATIMAPWLQKLDNRFRREKRHVLLLLDNFSAHIKGMDGLCLTNLKVEFLPPNLTSVLQPCDAGIIRAFKAYYQKQFLEFAMTQYKDNPEAHGKTVFNINQLEAMHLARSAWESVPISNGTVRVILNPYKNPHSYQRNG